MEGGMFIQLLTSPTCPHYWRAKEVAERLHRRMPRALVVERDVSQPEKAEIARGYGILRHAERGVASALPLQPIK